MKFNICKLLVLVLLFPFVALSETRIQCGQTADVVNTTATVVTGCEADTAARYFVTNWSCKNSSAVDSWVELYSGSTLIWGSSLPSKAGFNIPFVIELQGNAVNESLNIKVADTSTATRCYIKGFKR